jgi:hypothetical protein
MLLLLNLVQVCNSGNFHSKILFSDLSSCQIVTIITDNDLNGQKMLLEVRNKQWDIRNWKIQYKEISKLLMLIFA